MRFVVGPFSRFPWGYAAPHTYTVDDTGVFAASRLRARVLGFGACKITDVCLCSRFRLIQVAAFRSGTINLDMKYGIWNAPPEPIGAEYSAAGFVNRLQGCGAVLYRRRMIDDGWFHPEAHGTANFDLVLGLSVTHLSAS